MTKARLAYGLVLVLAVLHYDFWNWRDESVVFGFLPFGLFYQVLISLGAAVAWLLVVRLAWPTWIEAWANVQDPAEEQR